VSFISENLLSYRKRDISISAMQVNRLRLLAVKTRPSSYGLGSRSTSLVTSVKGFQFSADTRYLTL
jgi:hypothetical protein